METANERRYALAFYALAGFEAGMLGVLVMLAWLGAASAWHQRSVWTTENLMASVFYGQGAFRDEFGFRTLSGLAVYLIVYSLLGAAYAFLARERMARFRIVAAAVLAALVWYYLWFHFLLERMQPSIWLYTPDRPMMVGHIFYGLMLGRYPLYARRLRGEEPAPAPSEPAVADPPTLPDEQPANTTTEPRAGNDA